MTVAQFEYTYPGTHLLTRRQTTEVATNTVTITVGMSAREESVVDPSQIQKAEKVDNPVLVQYLHMKFQDRYTQLLTDLFEFSNVVVDPEVNHSEWLALSEQVLSPIWDNDKDAMYDDL